MTQPSKRARAWLKRQLCLTLATSVVLAAMVGLIVSPIVPHYPQEFIMLLIAHPAAFGWNALYCTLIGLLEELFLCGVLVPVIYNSSCIRKFFRTQRKISHITYRLGVALFCAGVFGLLHIGTGLEMNYGWVGVLLKVIQAGMFGFCMVVLRMMSGSVIPSITTHAVFDLLYIGIPNVARDISPMGVQSFAPELFGPALFVLLFLLIPTSYAFVIIKRKNMIDPSLLPRQVWFDWLDRRSF